jgi:hypothetical protein
MPKVVVVKIAVISLLLLSFQAYFLAIPPELDSANLTSVKDTLSTSRLSYYNSLNGAHTAGTSIIKVNTSGMPSVSTANLFTGDTVLIGDDATATEYTVDDIIDTDEFQITAALGSGDNDDDDIVIATRSATHSLSFTTATAIPNGAIRILIPSGANGVNDGIPNHDGFDFNGISANELTAPTDGGVTSWESPTATVSGGTLCTAGDHCFEARYNGTNTATTALTFTIGDGGATDLINPAAGASHTAGTADSYTVTIQHLGSRTDDYPVIDQTTVSIAVIESVRVTATVDPTITFTIAGVSSSTSTCGITTDVTTTATAVPFGTMALNTFKTLAQTLTVSTNGVGGYAVTAIENDQLGKDGATSPFIADTPCDSGPCTESSEEDWNTATNNGFGYSLDNDDAAAISFEYNDTGTFDARQFAATAETEAAQSIFSSTTVANAENANVCYRLSIGATQAAGDYENNITYTATATF